jgi:eukaryotic-like serine/threonine-protein kinase
LAIFQTVEFETFSGNPVTFPIGSRHNSLIAWSAEMGTVPNCPNCGAPLPANAPAGVCPRCLLATGMGLSSPEADDDPEAEATVLTDSAPAARDGGAPTLRDAPASQEVPETGEKVRYFGEYELLAEIARGGMGVVYKARQVRLNRIVALKMILAGQFAGKADVQRFHTEAEAAAQLDHPGIVPIYEVGEHEGHHFFTMGFVEGGSLASRLLDGPLPPREAARLVQQIAVGVQYAHERGVIHRDLKPANVLLDRDGQPRITDFGLAKNIRNDSALTASGQVLGTPGYMPPEQASGNVSQVTVAADVYSMGTILYALLTGRPPFQADNLMDTLMQVIEREPVSPSALNGRVPRDLETICLKCLEKDRRRRYASAHELADDLLRFLEGRTIQARPAGALERGIKWVRRHPAVSALSAAVVVALIGGTITSTAFGVRWQRAAESESVAKRDAQEKQHLAEILADEKGRLAEAERVANDKLRHLNTRLLLEKGLDRLERGRVAEGLLDLTDALESGDAALEPVVRANLALWEPELHRVAGVWKHEAPVNSIVASPEGDRVAVVLAGNRSDGGAFRIWKPATHEPAGQTRRHPGRIERAAFSRDGQWLVIVGGAFAQRFRAESGEPFGEPLSHAESGSKLPAPVVHAVAFFPGGKSFVTGTSRGRLHRWDVETGAPVGEPLSLPAEARNRSAVPIHDLQLSPGGETILAVSQIRRAWLLDAATVELRGEPISTKGFISCAAFIPDGRTVLTGIGGGEGFVHRGEVRFWDSGTGAEVGNPIITAGRVTAIDVNRDGTLLAVGGADHQVGVWELPQRQPRGVRVSHEAPVTQVRFAPNGKLLASADAGGTVVLTDPNFDQQIGRRLTQGAAVSALTFHSPNGALVTGTANGVVRVWEPGRGGKPERQWELNRPVTSVAFDEHEQVVHVGWSSTATESAGLQGWSPVTGEPATPARTIGMPNSTLVFSPNRQFAANWQPVTKEGRPNTRLSVDLWDVAGEKSQTIDLPNRAGPLPGIAGQMAAVRIVFRAEFSPDSRHLFVAALPLAGPQGLVWLIDVESGNAIGSPATYAHPSNPRFLETGVQLPLFQFDATGENLLLADLEKVAIRKCATAEKIRTIPVKTGLIRAMTLAPNRRLLATSSGVGQVDVWDISSAEPPVPIWSRLHSSGIASLDFSPDGRLLATAADDRTVHLWDAASGAPFGKPMVQSESVLRLCFDPRGDRLVVVGIRSVEIRDVATQVPVGPRLMHPSRPGLIEFSSQGNWLLTAAEDRQVRLWPLRRTTTRTAAAQRALIERPERDGRE